MREEELHLVGEHATALQIDVFGVGGREGHCDELHARLLRCQAALVVVAAPTRGYDIGPGIGALF